MTSSLTDDTNTILDHGFFQNDEQDILDEFLDQRVYDSIGTNTPNSTSQIKLENDLLDVYSRTNSSTQISPKNHYTSGFTMQDDRKTDSDYLYMDNGKSSHSSPGDLNNDSMCLPTRNAAPPSDQLNDFDVIRDELSKIKFGNYFMNPCPESIDIPDQSYVDTSLDDKLPYKLNISNLPSYSRVETQIKMKLTLSPPPPEALLYIPQDLISKNKFCLNEPVESLHPKLKENLLYLDAYVLTSDLKKSCNICSRCIKREQKRASRRKAAMGMDEESTPADAQSNAPMTTASGVVKNNPTSWANDKMMKKAIIFNCKEIMSFPPPNGLNNDLSKSLELSARLICYCRHHKESDGFKLLFVVKNNKGEVVAKQLSSPIVIMDRKKNTSVATKSPSSSMNLVAEHENGSKRKQTHSNSNSENEMELLNASLINTPATTDVPKTSDFDNDFVGSLHPLSPNSLDESASYTDDSRGLKRKKMSVDESFNTSTNPMYNGSVNGFSPISNSDTNTSTHQVKGIPMVPGIQPTPQQMTVPSIQRIIPAQGPIRGGIEVTLLGFNFRPGLLVKFGANQALATHCWSDSTIVTYLPPASQPGQVLVSFENHDSMMMGGPQQQQIFTYTDDTDRQLIELALQIVGLKMNGKLEDARNIAKRIVGTDNKTSSNSNAPMVSHAGNMQNNMAKANIEWFDNAHKAVEDLTKSGLSTQDTLTSFLSLVDLPNCPIIIPNWQLCNAQGQTLLHLATMKNYGHLVKFLITHGCKIDSQDNQGITPLFLALMWGHRDLIKIFVDCKSNWNLKLSNNKYLKDYCDLNVLDLFNDLEAEDNESDEFGVADSADYRDGKLSKNVSLDSLNSMFTMNYGRHVSKMVMDNKSLSEEQSADNERKVQKQMDRLTSSFDVHSEFADSEFESSDDVFEETDDFDDDYEDETSSMDGSETTETIEEPSLPEQNTTRRGLWQKVKNVFANDEEESLPSYDDLFPFGPSSFHSKLKSPDEERLNQESKTFTDVSAPPVVAGNAVDSTTDEVGSDSSEDIVISYINHPRKTFENDKMLLFFWFPALVCTFALFFMVSVMGYKIEFIDSVRVYVRDVVGNLFFGDERIGKVFRNDVRNVWKPLVS